jgi:hypothetical protein
LPRSVSGLPAPETDRELKTNEEASMATPSRSADWRTRWAAPPRTQYTSETKPFFLTSEFLVFVLFIIGLAIASGTSDTIDDRYFWSTGAAVTIAYIVSRGIAKAGSRSRAYDPREDIDIGRPDR